MTRKSFGQNIYPLSVFICFLWAGLVLGISFMEAPLKFQAPGITLGLGLGIGRLVFGVLNKIEIILLVSLIVVYLLSNRFFKITFLINILVIILLLQSLWLLPVLDSRADLIISNKPLPAGSSPHIFYVVIEFVKLVCLIFLGFVFFRNKAEQLQDI